MSLLAYLPGAKIIAKSAGKTLNRVDQKSEALHNAFMPVTAHDNDTDYDVPQSRGSKIVEQFREQVKKGLPFTMSAQSISSILDALSHSTAIDDRQMLLEHALVFISRLPDGALAQKLQDQAVQLFWYDLPHPPATSMGKFQWRSADGSGNNVSIPEMGKAGSPYSRSVQATHALVATDLPEPELVYQSLLRRDKFVPHPAGLSSLMFGFATLVIHSIFRTSFTQWAINETSSYIDLGPLYGNDQATQDSVRKKDGRGGLHPDVFAEDRLLLLPPASAVILVLFNRNHNYIAKRLLDINERGGYVDPETLKGSDKEAARLAQDDEIFNTTRLVNCMWFAQIVFSDYFAAILGLVRDGSSWNLNPFGEIRRSDHSQVERGQGNNVSIEFNLLYRWHATMSEANEKWTEDTFSKVFNGEPFDKITPPDFARAMRRVQASIGNDPSKWSFGGIEREADDSFKDADLAKILQDATLNPASAFKARGSPKVMRIIEIMGIEQARSWGACSLNDFRRFLQLKPYSDFEDWNPDPEIAETARRLYGNIENLELYPGLQAEEAKPVVPGAGLCPAYTTSRAILADAIALTRGDRFFTADLTPWNLTAWGFQDCQRDTTNAGFGSMLGRLLLRTLPAHYTYDSVYTWFALMTPEAMKTNLTKLGVAEKYTFSRPDRSEHPHVVNTFSGVSSVLKDRVSFRASYVGRAKEIIPGRGYLLSLDDPVVHKADSELVTSALSGDAALVDKAAQFYLQTTKEMIEENSYTLFNIPGRSIDIVGDVLNLVPIHFVSIVLAGFPLKTKQNPHGIYMDRQLMTMLRDVFSYIFFETNPSKQMRAKELAISHTAELIGHIKSHLKEGSPVGEILHTIAHVFHNSNNKTGSHEFIKKLSASKRPRDELANDVFSVVLLASVEFAQALVHVVNLYLNEEHRQHLTSIMALAKTPGAAADAQLQGYAREALRLDPSIRGTLRHPQQEGNVDGVKVSQDRPLYLSFANANLDPDVFINPSQIDPSRPLEGYLSLNDAIFGALGGQFVEKMIAQVLRAVFSLKNVRRTAGPSGTLKRVVSVANGTANYEYLDINRELSPWARSMVLQYDE
ncbi:linoleate diol synthase [Gautieria morchelliformis]|nr:linoleate diol synthase [Gautieria morchelliformis]